MAERARAGRPPRAERIHRPRRRRGFDPVSGPRGAAARALRGRRRRAGTSRCSAAASNPRADSRWQFARSITAARATRSRSPGRGPPPAICSFRDFCRRTRRRLPAVTACGGGGVLAMTLRIDERPDRRGVRANGLRPRVRRHRGARRGARPAAAGGMDRRQDRPRVFRPGRRAAGRAAYARSACSPPDAPRSAWRTFDSSAPKRVPPIFPARGNPRRPFTPVLAPSISARN